MTGRVYLAMVGRRLKIGYTARSVRERLSAHRQAFGSAPKLLGVVQGGPDLEAALHSAFDDRRSARAGTSGPRPELFNIGEAEALDLLGHMAEAGHRVRIQQGAR